MNVFFPMVLIASCERFITAPLRVLSRDWLFVGNDLDTRPLSPPFNFGGAASDTHHFMGLRMVVHEVIHSVAPDLPQPCVSARR